MLFNTMISFLRLTASLNKILLFWKGSFDGWCPCGSKLNCRSKGEFYRWSLFPAKSGVIDKTPHLICPEVQKQETGQALFVFSFPLCLK